MIAVIIRNVCFIAISAIMTLSGYGIYTWQWWAVIALTIFACLAEWFNSLNTK